MRQSLMALNMLPKPALFDWITGIIDRLCARYLPFCDACYFDDGHSFGSKKKDRYGHATGYGAPVGFTFMRVHTCRNKEEKNIWARKDT